MSAYLNSNPYAMNGIAGIASAGDPLHSGYPGKYQVYDLFACMMTRFKLPFYELVELGTVVKSVIEFHSKTVNHCHIYGVSLHPTQLCYLYVSYKHVHSNFEPLE